MFQWPDSYLPRLWLQCKEAKSLDTAGQKHLVELSLAGSESSSHS